MLGIRVAAATGTLAPQRPLTLEPPPAPPPFTGLDEPQAASNAQAENEANSSALRNLMVSPKAKSNAGSRKGAKTAKKSPQKLFLAFLSLRLGVFA
jgi:hypothetical protein